MLQQIHHHALLIRLGINYTTLYLKYLKAQRIIKSWFWQCSVGDQIINEDLNPRV